VSYTQGPATIALTGYFAGKSDDSTFIAGSDINFGNSLLLRVWGARGGGHSRAGRSA